MKKQKVLIICPIFPPHRFGGIEKIAFELAKNLASEKDAFVVCGQDETDKPIPAFQLIEGIKVFRTPQCFTKFPDFNFVEIIHKNTILLEKAVEVLLKNPDISLIHAHDWFVGLAAISLKNLFKLPLITTLFVR